MRTSGLGVERWRLIFSDLDGTLGTGTARGTVVVAWEGVQGLTRIHEPPTL